ncbi:hypothetical protein ACHAWF_010163 [Thalassiosira exigua]
MNLRDAAAAAAAKQKAAAAESPSSEIPIAREDPSPRSARTLKGAVAALKGPAPAGSRKSGPKAKAAKNKLRSAALALKVAGAATPWGDYAFLAQADVASLSNEKLKRHLRARNEVAEGTKSELIERLETSLEEERQRQIAIELELEAKHRKIADLEERGAVYVAGKNGAGQLGLGDRENRRRFVAIPSTRGKEVRHVAAGGDVVLATTRRHEVYAWGGSGLGPTGLASNRRRACETPQLVEKLDGEEVVATSVGANHACAASEGGDLFVWGLGVVEAGRGESLRTPEPRYSDAVAVAAVECGEMHTCAKTREGEAYAWGHSANGRLGCGECDADNLSSPIPVKFPSSEVVRLIACGSEHTLLCTRSAIYSFGLGDGGRLGHGSDFSDRYEPCEIAALKGSHVLSMSAGTWHSACVVHVPPLDDSGWLYTWGSGFQGQLGLGNTCKASTPTIVQDFVEDGLSIREVFCGSHHNAALAHDGNLYTWGSNKHGALGRSINEENASFTPHPGVVAEFGTIVDRIGRGLPLSVACGREYTVVATSAYDGPSEKEALAMAEEKRRRDEEEQMRQEELRRAREEELRQLREIEAEREKVRYLTSRRLCTMDPECPGFAYETNQPSICRECGFSVVYHTVVVDEEGRQKM